MDSQDRGHRPMPASRDRIGSLKLAAVILLPLALVCGMAWQYARGSGLELLGSDNGQVAVAVPRKMLAAISNELSSDASTMAALKGKVSSLDRVVSELRHQRASRRGTHGRHVSLSVSPAEGRDSARGSGDEARDVAQPERGTAASQLKQDTVVKQVAMQSAKRVLVEKQMDLVRDFPYWATNSGLADAAKGHGQAGEWRADRGPPFVQATTMFAGEGVDKEGSGNVVRRILGLKTTFRFHKWQGNSFLTNFDGPQFRYLYRNVHSQLVIPPLEMSGGPLLGWNAIHRLYLYVNEGHNSLIVTGGPASALFINNNVVSRDGGYDLQSKWAPGPYERQAAVEGTPFAACATTLPGPGTQVHGVSIASLPSEAVSYYESGDVSVLFSIPAGSGIVVYVGFDFSEAVTPWVHALIAATQLRDFNGRSRASTHA